MQDFVHQQYVPTVFLRIPGESQCHATLLRAAQLCEIFIAANECHLRKSKGARAVSGLKSNMGGPLRVPLRDL